MTKALSYTHIIAGNHRLYIARALLVGCLLMAILYATNVYMVVSRTVALQKVGAQEATIGGSVDNLDAKYLRLSSRITPDSLSLFGLSQGHVSEYISRSTSLSRVAMSGHEL